MVYRLPHRKYQLLACTRVMQMAITEWSFYKRYF